MVEIMKKIAILSLLIVSLQASELNTNLSSSKKNWRETAADGFETVASKVVGTIAKYVPKAGMKQYADGGPGIEIFNKSGKTIYLSLINTTADGKETAVNTAYKLKPRSTLQEGKVGYLINIDGPTALAVWLKDPNHYDSKTGENYGVLIQENPGNTKLNTKWLFAPTPDAYWEFRGKINSGLPGKTIYVTLEIKDDKITLRPQTGTNKGKDGKTASGLSLLNNLSDENWDTYVRKFDLKKQQN